MIRKLLIVFASAMALAILSLGGAWMTGGRDLVARINKGEDLNWSINRDDGGEGRRTPHTTREMDWSDTQALVLEVPVDLEYVRGPETRMTIRGPARIVRALRFEQGRLFLPEGSARPSGLRIEMRGPRLSAVTLRSAGHIELRDLDQPSLRIEAEGAGEIEGDGKVSTLEIDAEGVGSVDFSKLKARDARLEVEGVGNVEINANGAVEADISGIGNVTLHARPRSLTSRTDGIGSIERAY